MRRLALLLCLWLPAAGARAADAPERIPRFMLWELTSLGVESGTAELLSRMLHSELTGVLGEQLVDEPEGLTDGTRAAVARCGFTTECLGEAGGALGLDGVFTGSLVVLGDAYSLNLKLIDTHTCKDAARAKASLAGERARMLEALQSLVMELVGARQLRGSFTLDMTLEGVDVQIDGREVGTTPLAGPVNGLPVGEHTLKLTSPLIKDYFTFFKVQHGKTATVRFTPEQVLSMQADIEARAEPLHKRWWFWGAIATGLAAAATTAYFVTRDDGGGAPSTSMGTLDLRPAGAH